MINEDNFRPGVKPYCEENCPAGYHYIPELGHCYRLLVELGPTSQDRGVEACGFASGNVVSLDNERDEDIIRTYFWDKFGDRMKRHCNYVKQAGFWTAYVRKAGDGVSSETEFADEYVNLYTGEPMSTSFWRETQPSNERFDQACVARKWFDKQWISEQPDPSGNGLDDYVCAFPHWIVCQVRKEYALNKRASNLNIQEYVAKDEAGSLVAGSRCEQDWEEQTRDQFEILIANAKEKDNQRALMSYKVAKRNILNPTYSMLTEHL